MPSLHQHRLLLLVPANRRNAFESWFQTNINTGTGPTFDIPLYAAADTGFTTPIAYIANTSLTDAQVVAVLRKLCELANVTPPADLGTRTKQQKITWALSQRGAIRAATGIRFQPADNVGAWPDAEAELSAAGLARRTLTQ